MGTIAAGPARPPRSDGTTSAVGTQLYYRSVGTGTPLVVVHGGPGLGHYYLSPMEVLSDNYQVIFYDQRGSGRTELGDPDRVTLAGAVQDLEALLDGLGIEQANLLGHSFGADLSALFASRRPDRVASLVLANAGPPFDPDQQAVLGAEMERRRTTSDRATWERIPTFRITRGPTISRSETFFSRTFAWATPVAGS